MTNKNEMPELLLCPFCGGNDIGYYGDLCDGYGVACECGASAGLYEGTRGTYEITAKQKAVKAWNARADLSAPLPEDRQRALDNCDAIERAHPDLQPVIETIRRALGQPEWLPIESAPRGVNVIISCNGFVTSAVCNIKNNQWWELNNDPTDSWGIQLYPTHWMPLPQPPKDREG